METTTAPQSTYKFHCPIKLASKKNQYEIHFARPFWAAIQRIAHSFKGRSRAPLYWIDTKTEVKKAEADIAWIAKEAIDRQIAGPVRVTILFTGRLDVDNSAGAILDGLQGSGRIVNDRQVSQLVIERTTKDQIPGGQGCVVQVEELAA